MKTPYLVPMEQRLALQMALLSKLVSEKSKRSATFTLTRSEVGEYLSTSPDIAYRRIQHALRLKIIRIARAENGSATVYRKGSFSA